MATLERSDNDLKTDFCASKTTAINVNKLDNDAHNTTNTRLMTILIHQLLTALQKL